MSKLPNILTISRIVLLPVLIILIFSDSNLINFLSIVLFIVMSITDYLDGLIARKTKNTSNFGKMLDPIADKVSRCRKGVRPYWWAGTKRIVDARVRRRCVEPERNNVEPF